VANIPEDDAFVVQLACRAMHPVVQERFEPTGGVKTTKKALFSSLVRFDLVLMSWPQESLPDWIVGCALFHASEQGDEVTVRLLIIDDRSRADIIYNEASYDGHTPLMAACGQGHKAVARLLLDDHGANIEAVDNEGSTALMIACHNGHEAVARMLLHDYGADIEAVDNDGYAALMHACRQGHEAVARMLLDHKADFFEADIEGYTLLMVACEQGQEALVRLLLQRGAESIPEDEFGIPACNAVLRQWDALTPVRKDFVRRYDSWYYAEMPVETHALSPQRRKESLQKILRLCHGSTGWLQNFGQTLLVVLEALSDDEAVIRETALVVVKEMLRSQPASFVNFTEIIMKQLLEFYKGSVRKVCQAADEALEELTSAVNPQRCIETLILLIASEDGPQSIRMMSKLVSRLPSELLMELVPSICPGLFDAFKNPSSNVRKAVVFCLVNIYMVLGDDFAPFLGDLSTDQLKIVTIHIERMMQARGGGK